MSETDELLSSTASLQSRQPFPKDDTGSITDNQRLKTLPSISAFQLLFPFGATVFKEPINQDVQVSTVDHHAVNKFNPSRVRVDLTPRPVMAASRLIDLLARTNAGHYIDFRPVDTLLQSFGGAVNKVNRGDDNALDPEFVIEKVPASRSDVFQSDSISIVEKRLLTRFLKVCLANNQSTAKAPMPSSTPSPDSFSSFNQFMDSMKLSMKLKAFISSSIVFESNITSTAPESMSVERGLQRVKQFADSLMRFGTSTPFLFPNYGTGEISQALCRLCAVHGGTYVLRCHVTAIEADSSSNTDDNDVDNGGANEGDGDRDRENSGDKHVRTGIQNKQIVTSNGDVVYAKHVFISPQFFPLQQTGVSDDIQVVWRMVVLLDNPALLPARCMLTTSNAGVSLRVRQTDHTTFACSPGLFVLYAETEDPRQGGTEQDVIRVVSQFVDLSNIMSGQQQQSIKTQTEGDVGNEPSTEGNEQGPGETSRDWGLAPKKPRAQWAMTYARPWSYKLATDIEELEKQWAVHIPTPTDVEHDVDSVVNEAERLFRMVITDPDTEFFPDLSEELQKLVYDNNGIGGEDGVTAESSTTTM